MSDRPLSDLFAEGTAPERDPAFALRVEAGIGRARLRIRLLELALRAIVVLTLSGALFAAVRAIKPVLGQSIEEWPQFMGVPVPVVLGVVVVGLALRARRYLLPLRRFAPPPP